jgi:hypothetical protein
MQQIHILINKDCPLLIIVQSVTENVNESFVKKNPHISSAVYDTTQNVENISSTQGSKKLELQVVSRTGG